MPNNNKTDDQQEDAYVGRDWAWLGRQRMGFFLVQNSPFSPSHETPGKEEVFGYVLFAEGPLPPMRCRNKSHGAGKHTS